MYADLGSKARFLRLASPEGAGLAAVRGRFHSLSVLGRLSTLYIMFHGLNIIFLVARFLKLCHFQPKLGLITRTISAASADLGHYFLARSRAGASAACIADLALMLITDPYCVVWAHC